MARVDFSLRTETEIMFWGPMVVLVMTMQDGRTIEERMPALLAVEELLNGPGNGSNYHSGHIEWLGNYDEWSQSP